MAGWAHEKVGGGFEWGRLGLGHVDMKIAVLLMHIFCDLCTTYTVSLKFGFPHAGRYTESGLLVWASTSPVTTVLILGLGGPPGENSAVFVWLLNSSPVFLSPQSSVTSLLVIPPRLVPRRTHAWPL